MISNSRFPKISKLYVDLLNVSIVTRWIIFIFPILGILWIPGILGIVKFPKATVCDHNDLVFYMSFTFWVGMGSEAFMVEHLAFRGVGW
jgi:hypothetical protein